jgi:hypothetical protein
MPFATTGTELQYGVAVPHSQGGPTCEDAGKSRNRGSFFFESGIESSIESGYTQTPRAGSI